MGTWGHGSFQNDHACDWRARLLESTEPTGFVQDALNAHQTESDETRLLAAAEIVAAATGSPPSADMPANVIAWIGAGSFKPDPAMRERARRAVEAVRDTSGLKDLWNDAGELDEWCAVVDGLLARLSP